MPIPPNARIRFIISNHIMVIHNFGSYHVEAGRDHKEVYEDRSWLAAGRLNSVGSRCKRSRVHTSLPRKPRRATIFRICSSFNATGRALEARAQRVAAGAPRGAGRPGWSASGAPGPPDRSTWHAEPVKVFDNLYFFGQSEYAVWAITTSEGIIVLDTIFDYSVEDEVAGGMKKLGLDPANIKYAVVSHAHPDHDGGARFLQDHYGTRVIMSPADWDVLDKRTNGTKPKRDIEATDGQKLTLGDTTLTLYITPGHTPGTISTVFPVKDNGTPHLAALWGGVGLNHRPGIAFRPTSDRRSDSAAS